MNTCPKCHRTILRHRRNVHHDLQSPPQRYRHDTPPPPPPYGDDIYTSRWPPQRVAIYTSSRTPQGYIHDTLPPPGYIHDTPPPPQSYKQEIPPPPQRYVQDSRPPLRQRVYIYTPPPPPPKTKDIYTSPPPPPPPPPHNSLLPFKPCSSIMAAWPTSSWRARSSSATGLSVSDAFSQDYVSLRPLPGSFWRVEKKTS